MATADKKFSPFTDIVDDFSTVRDVMGEPPPLAIGKEMDQLDEICKQVIQRSSFVVIASANSAGCPDISPKGDPAGFIKVLDNHYLVIPDRPGNRRADTFKNILQNPYLSLVFFVPGSHEILRVTGEVRIVRDQALRESLSVNNKIPKFAIVMFIEKAMLHCASCIARAKLWEPAQWLDTSGSVDMAEALILQAKLDMTKQELAQYAEEEGFTELY